LNSINKATRSRRRGCDATVLAASFGVNVPLATSRLRGRKIGAAGLPVSFDSRTAQAKKSRRTEITFALVRGVRSPQRLSMNSRRRSVPDRRLEVAEFEVGVVIGYTLFNAGGTIPGTGTGDIVQTP
jgi:hypothetical protein